MFPAFFMGLQLSRKTSFIPHFYHSSFSVPAGDVAQLQLPVGMQNLYLYCTGVTGKSKDEPNELPSFLHFAVQPHAPLSASFSLFPSNIVSRVRRRCRAAPASRKYAGPAAQ